MTTLILGTNSFVASHLPYDKYQLWFENGIPSNLKSMLERYQPKYLINCCGMTGSPNIDQLEEKKYETSMANTVLPIYLATNCANYGVKLIHISSGCIFNDTSPEGDEIPYFPDTGWKETDMARPVSYYGRSKLAADLLLEHLPNVCILRIRMPISTKPNPRNLLSKLIKYNRIVETPNSMTFMDDLKNAIDWVICKNKSGIYNVASPKPILHSELLTEYQKYYPDFVYEKISTEELNKITKTGRSNCVLNMKKIISEGFIFEDTNKAIERYVKEFARNLKGNINVK